MRMRASRLESWFGVTIHGGQLRVPWETVNRCGVNLWGNGNGEGNGRNIAR